MHLLEQRRLRPGQLDCDRHDEPLRLHAAGGAEVHQPLEQDPLVRGVLIDEDEIAAGVPDDVRQAELADQLDRGPPVRRGRAGDPQPLRLGHGGSRPGVLRGPGVRAGGAGAGLRASRLRGAGRRRDVREVGLAQRAADVARHPASERALVDEPDLRLARVDVDVDLLGRHVQAEDRDRVPVLRDQRAERLREGPREERAPHHASVDEEPLARAARLRDLGRAEHAGHPRERAGGLQVQQVLDELGPQDAARARRERLRRGPQDLPPLEDEAEADVGRRERQPFDGLDDHRALARVRSQELAARGRVEEEVLHRDRGAVRAAGGTGGFAPPAGDDDPRGRLRAAGTRDHRDPRDRGDARERFSPEPVRAHPREVGGRANLARREALEREGQLARGDPVAVVGDADQALARALDLNRDAARPGVEAVLDELLHDGRGPLHDLAGGDALRRARREDLDRGAGLRRRHTRSAFGGNGTILRTGASSAAGLSASPPSSGGPSSARTRERKLSASRGVIVATSTWRSASSTADASGSASWRLREGPRRFSRRDASAGESGAWRSSPPSTSRARRTTWSGTPARRATWIPYDDPAAPSATRWRNTISGPSSWTSTCRLATPSSCDASSVSSW